MPAEQIVPGVFRIPLGFVNVFLLEDGEKLALIDAGMPNSVKPILAAIRELGHQPGDVTNILVTQLHGDHTGGLAQLKQATGACVAVHAADADCVRQGIATREVKPAPGVLNWLVVNLMSVLPIGVRSEPAAVDRELLDGEVLDVAGGLLVVHAPGHTAGHTSFLWPKQGGVLFVGDAAFNVRKLGLPFLFEDEKTGMESLRRLAGLDFEVACFSHGRPILRDACRQFRARWA